jgi:ABC-type sulfate transport system permease component
VEEEVTYFWLSFVDDERWLAGYGFTLSLAMVALTVAGVFGWGPAWLRAFFTGFGIGAVGALLWLTYRQNRRLRALHRRLEGST